MLNKVLQDQFDELLNEAALLFRKKASFEEQLELISEKLKLNFQHATAIVAAQEKLAAQESWKNENH